MFNTRLNSFCNWISCTYKFVHIRTDINSMLQISTGQTTAVLLLPRDQRERMGDGVSHSVHKGHWWPLGEGRAASGPKEWAGTCHAQPPPGQWGNPGWPKGWSGGCMTFDLHLLQGHPCTTFSFRSTLLSVCLFVFFYIKHLIPWLYGKILWLHICIILLFIFSK